MYGLYAPFFVPLSSGVCKGNPPMTAHDGLLFMFDLLMESDATNYQSFPHSLHGSGGPNFNHRRKALNS